LDYFLFFINLNNLNIFINYIFLAKVVKAKSTFYPDLADPSINGILYY